MGGGGSAGQAMNQGRHSLSCQVGRLAIRVQFNEPASHLTNAPKAVADFKANSSANERRPNLASMMILMMKLSTLRTSWPLTSALGTSTFNSKFLVDSKTYLLWTTCGLGSAKSTTLFTPNHGRNGSPTLQRAGDVVMRVGN